MGRLTSKKNVTAATTASIAGFLRGACRFVTLKDGSSGGTGQTQILMIASRPKRTCDVFPDCCCGRRTKNDVGSREISMTLRDKILSLWQRCLVAFGIQFHWLTNNHTGCSPSVASWRTGASAKCELFLTCYTHLC